MPRRQRYLQVFAIIRLDEGWRQCYSPTMGITVKAIVPDMEQAAAEVERLAGLNRDKQCEYFWQATRWPVGQSLPGASPPRLTGAPRSIPPQARRTQV